MTKTKVFKFYSDSGHGWLAVKRQELENLGLVNAISHYSYVKGKTVYLEEDRDATLFKNAYTQAHGIMLNKDVDHGDRSWIRGLQPFLTTSNQEFFDVDLNNEAIEGITNGINNPGLLLECGHAYNDDCLCR